MKKLVSRFMAVLMAMTMILSMSMTVLYAEAPKGTLTVNNTVAGKDRICIRFTATKTSDNVAYTLNSVCEGFFQNKITGASKLKGEAQVKKHMQYVKRAVDDGSKGATFAKDILGWILVHQGGKTSKMKCRIYS